jgi:hypothetical protein
MPVRLSLAIVLLVLGGAPGASAQDLTFLTGLFKSVNSVSLYLQGEPLSGIALRGDGQTSDLQYGDLPGVGAEVYLNLPDAGSWQFEFSLGTHFSTGATTGNPEFDLRLSTRTFPALGFYGTYDGIPIVKPYLGAHFGITELWNTQAYDIERRQFAVTGQTYDLGVGGGFALDLGPVRPYVDLGYVHRNFGSLSYRASGEASIPQGWPRDFDLSGLALSLGLQFDVARPPSAPSPPSFEGDWVLTRLDGGGLPAIWDQTGTAAPAGPSRSDVLDGRLILYEDAERGLRYVLWLLVRTVDLSAGAERVVAIRGAAGLLDCGRATNRSSEPPPGGRSHLELVSEAGPCDPGRAGVPAGGERLALAEEGPEPVYRALRDGDALTIILPGERPRHLEFRKAAR